VPSELFFWVWADSRGESTRVKHFAEKISGTNNWEVSVPRASHGNAVGDYSMSCWAVNSPETQVKGGLKTTIKKDAIIVMHGMMGSRLEFDGVQVWEPDFWNFPLQHFLVNMKPHLFLDEEGQPIPGVSDVEVINDYKGAQDSYDYLYASLEAQFSNEYDVKFFMYDWRLDNTSNAKLLENFTEEYDKIIIVAHSMGGLLSSKYINLSDDNRDKVQKLITIATPYLGSTKVIAGFETGETMEFPASLLMNEHIKEIIDNYSSAYQLMPTVNHPYNPIAVRGIYEVDYEYLDSYEYRNLLSQRPYSLYDGTEITKSIFYNAIDFQDSITDLSSVPTYYIYGTGIDTPQSAVFFDYGSDIYSFSHFMYGDGDGTVIPESATRNFESPTSVRFAFSDNHQALANNIGVTIQVRDIIWGHETPVAYGIQQVEEIDTSREKGVSVVVQGIDNINIADSDGNEVIVENNEMYININNDKVYVGSRWLINAETMRYQYTFHNISAIINISGVKSELSPEVLMITYNDGGDESIELYNEFEDQTNALQILVNNNTFTLYNLR
jgi:pimeloyl-ACP methyl ester carboxylesterase